MACVAKNARLGYIGLGFIPDSNSVVISSPTRGGQLRLQVLVFLKFEDYSINICNFTNKHVFRI